MPPWASIVRQPISAKEWREREKAKLAAYLNNEVVPAVRGRSSKALQVTAQKLSELAEDLDAEQRKEP